MLDLDFCFQAVGLGLVAANELSGQDRPPGVQSRSKVSATSSFHEYEALKPLFQRTVCFPATLASVE